MKKLISRQTHGVADYSYATLFAVAPELVGFTDEEIAARLSRVVGGGVALTSLLTRYELGLIRVLPFKAHLVADVAVGLLTLAAPFAFGFSGNKRARNFFVGMGAFSILAGLLTEPEEMREEEEEEEERVFNSAKNFQNSKAESEAEIRSQSNLISQR
jgi:hypothetical protein